MIYDHDRLEMLLCTESKGLLSPTCPIAIYLLNDTNLVGRGVRCLTRIVNSETSSFMSISPLLLNGATRNRSYLMRSVCLDVWDWCIL